MRRINWKTAERIAITAINVFGLLLVAILAAAYTAMRFAQGPGHHDYVAGLMIGAFLGIITGICAMRISCSIELEREHAAMLSKLRDLEVLHANRKICEAIRRETP